MGYIFLAIAIISEVIATSTLKATEGFTRFFPSLAVVMGYVCCFYCLSQVLKTVPVGVAYTIWCGLGIVLITLVAAIAYKQIPVLPAMIGMALIIAGVVVIQVFSNTSA